MVKMVLGKLVESTRLSAAKPSVAALTGAPDHKKAIQPKRQGAQPGNRNSLKNGRYTHATIMARQLLRARLKAYMHIMVAHRMLADDGSRTRPRPMRGDQLVLLAEKDPELAAIISSVIEQRYDPALAGMLAGIAPIGKSSP